MNSYYQKSVLRANRTAFMFDSLGDYDRFINEISAAAPNGSRAREQFDDFGQDYINRRARDSNWYGTSDVNLITENIDTYLFNNELDSYLNNVRSRTISLDVIDLDQQKSIKFTEQEIGVFSFDLASLGLIPVVEYFSPLLQKIVSGNLVRSEKLENGTRYFYHIHKLEIKEHIVEFNDKFNGLYSNVLNRVVTKNEVIEKEVNGDIVFYYPFTPEIQKHAVEKRQKIDEKGKKKWTTTFKKSFIYIPKVEKPLPRIDIIVGSSFSASVSARTEMIYSSMAAISIAEKLSKSGVNYRIVAAYPVQTTRGQNSQGVYTFVNVKKEGEALDKNKIAVLLSDGRNFRLRQFRGFIASMYDAGFDDKISDGIGAPIEDTTMIKNAYIEFLSLSPSQSDREAAKKPQSKIVFSGAKNQQQAEDQYNDIIREISKVI